MNQKPLDSATLVIPAGSSLTPGVAKSQLQGHFFLCRSASSPFRMQFDGGTAFPCEAGFWTSEVAFNGITFFNVNPYPITVFFYTGAQGVGYSGTILAQNLPTYNFGNLGLAASGTYNGFGLLPQTITFFGFDILVSGSTPLKISGVNNGNKRKQIIITCHQGGDNMLILDANNNPMLWLPVNNSITFESSDTVSIKSDVNGTTHLVVQEIYYAA